jgi:hypothetical protein
MECEKHQFSYLYDVNNGRLVGIGERMNTSRIYEKDAQARWGNL